MTTKLGKLMRFCKKLRSLKSHDELIKLYLRFDKSVATKLGRVLTSRRTLRTQKPLKNQVRGIQNRSKVLCQINQEFMKAFRNNYSS